MFGTLKHAYSPIKRWNLGEFWLEVGGSGLTTDKIRAFGVPKRHGDTDAQNDESSPFDQAQRTVRAHRSARACNH
jgi:hypothetical protein